MCGIAGIVNFNLETLDHDVIEQMTNVLRHRGPDGKGFFRDRHIALGHTRLSIIDVEGSKQPMSNEDGTVWVVYNGEIYNFAELRKELGIKGHTFKTKGDTEVLVHLYEEYNEEMVHSLVGMFAFAIWDKNKQELFMARDRLGIKPLYYCQKDDNFLFASEPKSILQHPGCKASPDPEAIWHYLTYRSVPSPATLFDGIKKLGAGHLLRICESGTTEKSYWDIPLVPKKDKNYGKKSSKEYIEEAEALLLTSVRRRLISDVPLGAFLSGGVDSSLIVAMMSKLSNAPIRTYSVGFRNFASSELPFARVVSDLFGTDHHEVILEEKCFAEHLEKLTWMRDSPLSEGSDVPLYLLAAEANKDVKVLLSGEGCDELFGGYPKYAYDRFSCIVSIFPQRTLCLGCGLLPARFRRLETAFRSLCEKDDAKRWAQWFAPFTPEEKTRLLHIRIDTGNPTSIYTREQNRYEDIDKMLYADCKLWLPENLLERGDRMTMAASVEGRVPFLDHEFVEFAFRVPSKMKIRRFTRKWLVKALARKYLPEHIVTRKKIGFEVPLAQWFRGKLRDMCYDRICNRNGLTQQILKREELVRILDDHCSKRKDNFLKIWTLLGLSIWYDLFCRNDCQYKVPPYGLSFRQNRCQTNQVS